MQHDYNLANQSGAAFRADANNLASAIVSLNSGSSAPATTFAQMLWADTTTGWLKQRNGSNTAWVLLFPLGSTSSQVVASARNLRIYNNGTNPTYQVDVTADEAVLKDSNGAPLRVASISVTADLTASGAGGLDTGTEAMSTWYYLWLIAQADGTVSVIFSASSSAPTMPGTYTFKMLVGAVYNDGVAGDLRQFHQYGDKIVYDDPMYVSSPTISATEATWNGFTTFTPPIAKSQTLRIQLVLKEYTTDTWQGFFFLGIRSGHYIVQIYRQVLGLTTGSYWYDRDNEFEIPYLSSSLYYYMQGGTTNFFQVSIFNIGFRLSINAS